MKKIDFEKNIVKKAIQVENAPVDIPGPLLSRDKFIASLSDKPWFLNSVKVEIIWILKSIANYATSSDINSFGGRLKYSKLLKQIDDTNTAITSNITTTTNSSLIGSINGVATSTLGPGFNENLNFNIEGKKVFILGAGPSLEQEKLSLLSNQIVIAYNFSYRQNF